MELMSCIKNRRKLFFILKKKSWSKIDWERKVYIILFFKVNYFFINMNPLHPCQRCFVTSLFEIYLVGLEIKNLNFVKAFFAISLLSLLEKGCGPLFEQIWILFTQRWFVASLLDIGPVDLEKKNFRYQSPKCNMKVLKPILAWIFSSYSIP